MHKLDALPIDELRLLELKVSAELHRRRKSFEQLLTLLNTSLEKPVRRGAKKGSKAAPKYKGPNGETWSGRGLRPRWLAGLVSKGHSTEEFALD